MSVITQKEIHEAICKMPDEKKVEIALACESHCINPEQLENTMATLLNNVIEPVARYLKYWSD